MRELELLFELAVDDDRWTDRVKAEIEYYDAHPHGTGIELLHVISNMRIAQFIKFIWQFDIIPQWNGKLSEVNYKALAQHYGFETFLLDITNDVRDALFFATCKWVKDHFEPLTEHDINRTERSKYGVIYHSPDWMIDFLNGTNRLKLQESFEKENGRNTPSVIDTGLWYFSKAICFGLTKATKPIKMFFHQWTNCGMRCQGMRQREY